MQHLPLINHFVKLPENKGCIAVLLIPFQTRTIDQRLSQHSVKELIQKEIKGVDFHKPTRATEPKRVNVKQCRDAAIHIVESTADSYESM